MQGREAGGSPLALTCQLYAEDEQHRTRKSLAIHEGDPALAPETRPGRPRAPAPFQATPGARAPACSRRGGSPSPVGVLAPVPVTHPCSTGAHCWNKGGASAPNALLPSFPSSLRPLHCEHARTKSQTLQPSLYFSVHLGSDLWMASESARGGGASLKHPRLLWVWPLHTLFTNSL